MKALANCGMFDLEERAQLAINCMTRLVDPELDYEPYFHACYDEEPISAYHYEWDYGDTAGRHVEALVLARSMTGSGQNREIDERLRSFLISSIEKDGLSWIPKTPWVDRKKASINSQGSVIGGLLALYRIGASSLYLDYIKRMVHRLWKISIKEDNYIYYPSPLYYPGGWEDINEPLENGTAAYGSYLSPILQYYEISKDEVVLKLIEGLINFLLTRAHDFSKDGNISPVSLENASCIMRNHFYTRSATIGAVLKYGLIANKPKYIEWAKNAYEQAKKWGSSFGWFPESINTERCETCGIMSMIETATMLAKNDSPQYWDDVEAFGLNHLLESQMLRTGWVKNIAKFPVSAECPACHRRDKRSAGSRYSKEGATHEDVVERNLGGFAGLSKPNDYIDMNLPVMMQCCNASGVKGLYSLWHNAVTKEKEGLFVNLFISRNSKWAEVRSFLPQAGILKVAPHIKTDLFIRKPVWMGENVEFTVNGKPLQVDTRHGFFNLGARRPGDEIVLYTPIVARERKEEVENIEYTTKWVGNIVVNIDPVGTIYPLYQRSYLLKELESI